MHKLYVSYINPYLQNCVRRVELKTTKMRYRSGRRGVEVGCASGARGERDSDDDDDNVVRGYDSSDDERYK